MPAAWIWGRLPLHKRVSPNIEKVCFNLEIYFSNHEVLKCDQDKHYWSSGHESYALKSSPWIPSVFQANVSLNDQSFTLSCLRSQRMLSSIEAHGGGGLPFFWTSEVLASSRNEQLLKSAHRRLQAQPASLRWMVQHGKPKYAISR